MEYNHSTNRSSAYLPWWDIVWIVGALIGAFQIISYNFPAEEYRDWIYYYTVAIITAIYLADGIRHHFKSSASANFSLLSDKHLKYIKMFLSIYGAAGVIYYLSPRFTDPDGIAIWVIAAIITYKERQNIVRSSKERGAFATWGIYAFLVCALYACLSFPIFLYLAVDANVSIPAPILFYTSIILGLLLYLLVFSLSWAAFNPTSKGWIPSKKALQLWHYAAHAIMILALLLMYFSTPIIFQEAELPHHWKAILEAANSIRDGGWLLWDVPSQYGFLQTLTIAFLPTDTVWHALHLLNGLILIATSYMIFRVFFSIFNSFWGFFFCVLLVLVSTKFLQNYFTYPSSGALRFVWVYAVLAYIAWYSRRPHEVTHQRISVSGNLLWLLGVLWSFESAIYVSIIWLPCQALFLLSRRYEIKSTLLFSDIVISGLESLAITALLLLVTVGAISAFYLAQLGVLPDVHMLFMYALSYTNNKWAISIKEVHNVTLLLSLFVACTIALKVYAKTTKTSKDLWLNASLFLGIITGLWTVSSYYAARSHPANVIALIPMVLYFCGLAYERTLSLKLPGFFLRGFSLFMFCFFFSIIISLILSYYNSHSFSVRSSDEKARLPKTESHSVMSAPSTDNLMTYLNIIDSLPKPSPALNTLIDKAEIPPHARMMVLAESFSSLEMVYFDSLHIRPWILPTTAVAYGEAYTADPLNSPETYQRIAERRAERLCGDGWLLEPKELPLESYPWIEKAIAKFYKPAGVFESETLRLRKYERLDGKKCD